MATFNGIGYAPSVPAMNGDTGLKGVVLGEELYSTTKYRYTEDGYPTPDSLMMLNGGESHTFRWPVFADIPRTFSIWCKYNLDQDPRPYVILTPGEETGLAAVTLTAPSGSDWDLGQGLGGVIIESDSLVPDANGVIKVTLVNPFRGSGSYCIWDNVGASL
jgi:hypothetical protein